MFEDNPFGQIRDANVYVTSGATNTQVMRMPWANPVNKIGKLTKLVITSVSGIPGLVTFWDQDLSNSTPVGRGSGTANGAIFSVAVGTNTNSGTPMTAVYARNDLPELIFEAGCAVQTTTPNIHILAEFEVY